MAYRSKWSIFAEMMTWWLLDKLIRRWATRYMDQFEKFRFKDPTYGYDVFVTISYYDEYQDSFDDLDHPNKRLTIDAESV